MHGILILVIQAGVCLLEAARVSYDIHVKSVEQALVWIPTHTPIQSARGLMKL